MSAKLRCMMALCCVFATGCAEDMDATYRQRLVGSWNADNESATLHFTFQPDGTFVYSLDGKGKLSLVTSINKAMGANEMHGTWLVNNSTLTMNLIGNTNPAADAFLSLVQATVETLGGDPLKSGPMTLKIVRLEGTQLVLGNGKVMTKVQ